MRGWRLATAFGLGIAIVALMVATGAATAGFSSDAPDVENLEPNASLDVKPLAPPIETRHVKWAKPYADGEIKALFLMFYDHQRDAVEMAERLDLEYDIIPYGLVYAEEAKEVDVKEKALVTLLKGKNYDVIVSAHYPLWKLSDEGKALLREKVKLCRCVQQEKKKRGA